MSRLDGGETEQPGSGPDAEGGGVGVASASATFRQGTIRLRGRKTAQSSESAARPGGRDVLDDLADAITAAQRSARAYELYVAGRPAAAGSSDEDLSAAAATAAAESAAAYERFSAKSGAGEDLSAAAATAAAESAAAYERFSAQTAAPADAPAPAAAPAPDLHADYLAAAAQVMAARAAAGAPDGDRRLADAVAARDAAKAAWDAVGD